MRPVLAARHSGSGWRSYALQRPAPPLLARAISCTTRGLAGIRRGGEGFAERSYVLSPAALSRKRDFAPATPCSSPRVSFALLVAKIAPTPRAGSAYDTICGEADVLAAKN